MMRRIRSFDFGGPPAAAIAFSAALVLMLAVGAGLAEEGRTQEHGAAGDNDRPTSGVLSPAATQPAATQPAVSAPTTQPVRA